MRVNRADGRTETYDLDTDAGAEAWADVERDVDAQRTVRGVILEGDVDRVAISAPSRFSRVAVTAVVVRGGDGERKGERLDFQADEVRLSVTRWDSGTVKVALKRTGRARHLNQFRDRNRS